MRILSKISGMFIVAAAALAGNWAGDYVRSLTAGTPRHHLSFVHTTPEGYTVLGLNLALTNFVPALLLALLAGRPRTLYAFVSGALISALVGDSYERAVVSWLRGEAPTREQVRI